MDNFQPLVKSMSVSIEQSSFIGNDGFIATMKIVPWDGEPYARSIGITVNDNLSFTLDQVYAEVKDEIMKQFPTALIGEGNGQPRSDNYN